MLPASTLPDVSREPLAHLTQDGAPHLLFDHLVTVGELASAFASSFQGGEVARYTGRLHDLGKYAAAFQRRIRTENGFEAHLEADTSGRPNHSSAGALWAQRALGFDSIPVALAIAGHHAGIGDLYTVFRERFVRDAARLDEALQQRPPEVLLAPPEPALVQELEELGREPMRMELFTRMVFSSLCDADFLDTEAFYDPSRAGARTCSVTITDLQRTLTAFLDDKQRQAPSTPVNQVRREVLDACRGAAKLAPGVYSLTVPTGGGKTLSSLAFALDHARIHGLGRVVMAIPFTSITEQTTAVYREAFSPLGPDAVLEHHSMLDPVRETARNRIASENWDAPLVVTTTVQLFESLFANRPGACRKLHRLARSVIILDEAQTLPIHLLGPILDMLRALVEHYGCTVLICTATQPAFKRSPSMPHGFARITEIMPPELDAFERLRRVQVRWPEPGGAPTPYPELAEELVAEEDVLTIVHRRQDARELCEFLDERLGDRATFHLSALMCAAHRSEILHRIRDRKQAGLPVRLVATQLVEAGVDLDFAIVYRAVAGVDAMAQAAGRCNREGKLPGLGELRVFHAPTDPPKGVLATAAGIARGLIKSGPDLFDPALYEAFFTQLYAAGDPDRLEIQELRKRLNYPEVAKQFRMIEDDWSASLVIPRGEADALVRELELLGASRARLRQLQRYIVTVPKKHLAAWVSRGYVREVAEAVHVLDSLWMSAYDERFGLVPDRMGRADPELFIIDG